MQYLPLKLDKTRRRSHVLLRGIGWLILLLLTAWASAALWFHQAKPLAGLLLVIAYASATLLFPLLLRPRWAGVAVSLFLFSCVFWWYNSLSPSNDRNWQPDQTILPWAEIKDGQITMHNIRNCDYRTETDFTCSYYDRTFDLADLNTLDVFFVYWGSPNIAHTMLSFGFADQGQVCVSIETRKEVGEEYSAVKGFFRQYELTYIVADERDVVRLRTNYRHEDVYLYPLKIKPERVRDVFLNYVDKINKLKNQPEWYNALTANCTTSIRQHTAPYNPDARFDWRMIVNGYLDEMIYERGFFPRDLPFAELKKRCYINPKAQSIDRDPEFSRRIREGVPTR